VWGGGKLNVQRKNENEILNTRARNVYFLFLFCFCDHPHWQGFTSTDAFTIDDKTWRKPSLLPQKGKGRKKIAKKKRNSRCALKK